MSTEHLGRIIPIAIEDEMKKSYIDYSLSVITSRALANAYDGLKPVQRRILFAMHSMGNAHNAAYKKTATAVGETIGKYHPHGNDPIYMAMVRMAQPWAMRYPLIDGHGNFGSIDGDNPAAMRYTEARLQRLSEDGLLDDLSKETVNYVPNFDNSLEEPAVFPSRMPNLLLNGCTGIAVGMATNIAPHNLNEVAGAIKAYIDHKQISIDELMAFLKAPDFPTGGIIYGYKGVKDAFKTGRGRIIIRSKCSIETLPNGRERIIVTEIPYMVNKAQMIEKTAHLINEKALEGISDIRDESDRKGLRVVYELKRDAVASVVLNNLFQKTHLQVSFSVNNVALVHGKPRLLNVKQLIECYVTHRHDVVLRRTKAQHKHAMHHWHLVQGYLIALEQIDPIIKLIKKSEDSHTARAALMGTYNLSEIQAKAILDMRLNRLTGLERNKLIKQEKELKERIEELEKILAQEDLRMEIIKNELTELQERYGDERRTQIQYQADEFAVEDVIANEAMVITLSEQGYIKRTPLSTYKIQQRGGVGSKGSSAKKEDFLSHLFVAHAHDTLLIFTEFGQVYWKKVYELPEGSKASKGRSIKNLLPIASGDQIRSILKVENITDEAFLKDRFVTLCTERGVIKKTPIEAFSRPRTNGIRAISFKEGDRLLEAKLTLPDHYIILALKSGKAIRFNQDEVRSMGRTAAGVRGITLADKNDQVIGMLSTPEEKNTSLLVVSEKGYGKRSAIQDYRITRRGGKGIKTIQVTPKTGKLVAIKAVEPKDELMIMNSSGITLRMGINSLRTMRRATQGVRLLRLKENDSIASVAMIREIEE